MCAAFTYQSDCQQREDLSYLQGFTSKLAYNFQVSSVLSSIKPYLTIFNINSFLLKLIGTCSSAVGKISTIGLRNLSAGE